MPAVVTKVSPVLAEGKNFMPMVTVCPLVPNYLRYFFSHYHFSSSNKYCMYISRLLYELASLYPEVLEKQGLTREVRNIISEKLVGAKIAETDLGKMAYQYRHNIDVTKTLLKPCQHNHTNSSECSFINVLASIVAQKPFDYLDNYAGVKGYIRKRVLAQRNLTLQSFQDYVEEHYEIVIEEDYLKEKHYQVVQNLPYLIFQKYLLRNL